MVEKDVEFAIKQAIDIKTSSHITITNEYRSDGIIRIDGKPVGILEFKYKRNFTNEKTRAQILCQLLCYYRKLVDKEKMQMGKNFFFILGDENELYLLNVSKIDVIEQIKNYALNEMNNKSLENKNNYIRVILTEINKVKEDILKLDSSYTFEDINYSSFNTGNEIIDYLDSLFIKYYGIYLRLYDEKQKQNVYKKNLIPKIY